MGLIGDFFLNGRITLPERRSDVPLHDPSSARVPPARSSTTSRAVTTNEALGLSAVYRALQILTTTAKQLSVHVYRDDTRLDTPTLLKRPDIRSSRSAFIEQTVASLATSGNAFWQISRVGDRNTVVNIAVVDPYAVNERSDRNGVRIGWSYNGADYPLDAFSHLAIGRMPGEWKGLGPIQAAALELRGAIETRNYASNVMNSGGTPSGVLTSDDVLDGDTASQWSDAWDAAQHAGKTAVLGKGLKYQSTFLSPADAQWLEARQFDKTQIATLFGVPPRMMLAAIEGSGLTYANLQDEYRTFVMGTLLNYLKEIEDALSDLLPGSQTVKFNIDAFLRADIKTRSEVYAAALGKWMTTQEIRDLENLGPTPADLKQKAATPPPLPVPEEAANV